MVSHPYRTAPVTPPSRAPWWFRALARVAEPFMPPQDLAAYRWYRRAVGGRWCRGNSPFGPPCWHRVDRCEHESLPDAIVLCQCTNRHHECEAWP
jgi:hypothetical protein